ncbi:MAG: hypothetical protein OYL41_08430 [Acidobacteriota bacterium]|nr:hypothetical protein [Acidobacteriota bacterium]
MNTVFNVKPVRRGRGTETERIHEFLEREGRPEAAPIRSWIEHWYAQLPKAKQADVRGRLRSGKIDRFTEVYFELQMFALLRTTGHRVHVEPALSKGHYKPDFLAIRGSGAFYLEATVCGQSDHNAGALRVNANESDAVEKIKSALEEEEVHMHSDLWLEAEGNLDRTLSKREIGRPFIDLLKRTTAEQVERSLGSGLSVEEVFDCGHWSLRGFLDPNILKGTVGDVWGPVRSAVGDAADAISTSLTKKAAEWRRKGSGRDETLVIAVSVCHSQYSWNDGEEIRAIARDPTTEVLTAPWRDDLKDVAGVLFVGDVSLGNELQTKARLIQNPDRSLPESLGFLTTERKMGELTGFRDHVGHQQESPSNDWITAGRA